VRGLKGKTAIVTGGAAGIGLAIAQKIIDSHHGSIDVESEVGNGTTFTIKLPF